MAYEDDVLFRIGVVEHPNNAAAMAAMVAGVRNASREMGDAVGTAGKAASAQVSSVEQAIGRLESSQERLSRAADEVARIASRGVDNSAASRLVAPKIDPPKVKVKYDLSISESQVVAMSVDIVKRLDALKESGAFGVAVQLGVDLPSANQAIDGLRKVFDDAKLSKTIEYDEASADNMVKLTKLLGEEFGSLDASIDETNDSLGETEKRLSRLKSVEIAVSESSGGGGSRNVDDNAFLEASQRMADELASVLEQRLGQFDSALNQAVQSGAKGAEISSMRQKLDDEVGGMVTQFVVAKLEAGESAAALEALSVAAKGVVDSYKAEADAAAGRAVAGINERDARKSEPIRGPDFDLIAKLPKPSEYFAGVIEESSKAIEAVNRLRDQGVLTGEELRAAYDRVGEEMRDSLYKSQFTTSNPFNNVVQSDELISEIERGYGEAKTTIAKRIAELKATVEKERVDLGAGIRLKDLDKTVTIDVAVDGEDKAKEIINDAKLEMQAITAGEIQVKLGISRERAEAAINEANRILAELGDSPVTLTEFKVDSAEVQDAVNLLKVLKKDATALDLSDITINVGKGERDAELRGREQPANKRSSDADAIDDYVKRLKERREAEEAEADKYFDFLDEQAEKLEAAREKVDAARAGVDEANANIEAVEAKGPKFERIVSSTNQALEGIAKFGQGLAFLGLANKESSESLEKFLRTLAKVKGIGDTVVGLGKTVAGALKFFNQFGTSTAERARSQGELQKKTERLEKAEAAYERAARKTERATEGARVAAEKRLKALGLESTALDRNTAAQLRNSAATERASRGPVARRGVITGGARGRRGRLGGIASSVARNGVSGAADIAIDSAVDAAVDRGVSRVADGIGKRLSGGVASKLLARVGLGGFVSAGGAVGGGAASGGAASGGAAGAAGAGAAGAAGLGAGTIGLLVAGIAGFAGIANDLARGNAKGAFSTGAAGQPRSNTASLLEPAFRATLGPINEFTRSISGVASAMGRWTKWFSISEDAFDFLGQAAVEAGQRNLVSSKSLNEFDRALKLAAINAAAQTENIQNELANRLESDRTNATVFDLERDPTAELRARAADAQSRVTRANEIAERRASEFASVQAGFQGNNGNIVLDDQREIEARNNVIEGYRDQYDSITQQISVTKQLIAAKKSEADSVRSLERKIFDLNPEERRRALSSVDAAIDGTATKQQLQTARQFEDIFPELKDALQSAERKVANEVFGRKGGALAARASELDASSDSTAQKQFLADQAKQQAEVASKIAEQQTLNVNAQLKVQVDVAVKGLEAELEAAFDGASKKIREELQRMLIGARGRSEDLVSGVNQSRGAAE